MKSAPQTISGSCCSAARAPGRLPPAMRRTRAQRVPRLPSGGQPQALCRVRSPARGRRRGAVRSTRSCPTRGRTWGAGRGCRTTRAAWSAASSSETPGNRDTRHVSACSCELTHAAWLSRFGAATRLDAEHVDDERGAPQPLHGEGAQHRLHRQDRRRQDDHIRLLRRCRAFRRRLLRRARGAQGAPLQRSRLRRQRR